MRKKISGMMVGLVAACSVASAWDGATDAAAWSQLTNDVVSSRSELGELVAQAAAAGLNTDYAYVSQVVIDRFLVFAQYDRDHPSIMSNVVDATEGVWWGDKVPNYPHYSLELPFDEMQQCLEVSGNAIAELEAQLATNIVLQTPHDFSTGTMVLTNSFYTLDGQPCFPSTFTWMPADEDLMQAFGRLGGSFLQLTNLGSDETVKASTIKNEREDAFLQSSVNMAPQQVFLGHKAADWMIAAYPAITNGARNFVQYDTDSPLIRDWLTKLFEQIIPEVAGDTGSGDQPRICVMANEPNWATREGGWLAKNGVSTHTMDRYEEWITLKYTTISNLNATYETSYADFSAARSGRVMPIPTSLQGGPIWYDWCRFNMDRINDFFSFLKTGMQGNDPDASPVNIKILGPQLRDEWRDEGLDMEYLTQLQDVMGADNKMSPSTATDLNISESLEWMDRYGMDWVDQSMMLDFTKSLCPDKAFYDSEWHGLSTGRWRDFSMDRDYVRAALWLGFTHGMSAMQAWYWQRSADGSIGRGTDYAAMAGSVITLPSAMDAYGRTFKELNAHAESVTSLVPRNRSFMLYYCEEAAIQDLDYIPDLISIYESLKLLNVQVGFTTPTHISSLVPAAQTVVVPPTAYISDASYANLIAFNQAGGKGVLVNGSVESFGRNELGVVKTGRTNQVPYVSVALDDSYSMADDLAVALAPIMPTLPVQVDIKDADGQSAYGVLVSQSQDAVSGLTTLSLINVSKDTRTVILTPAHGNELEFSNLITQQAMSETLVMAPYDVLLLRTENIRLSWDGFVVAYGLSGVATNDFDADGQSDLIEYALGGNPTNAAKQGTEPSMSYNADDTVSFYTTERVDKNPSISYNATWTTNLVGGWWTNGWKAISDTLSDDANYHVFERQLDSGTSDQLFFRLQISQP